MGNRTRTLIGSVMAIAGLVMSVAGFIPGFTGIADAADNPAPITDYEKYPEGITPEIYPADCGETGAGVVTGEQYSVNGSTPVANLRDIPKPEAGQVITMTWTGFAPGCENAGVSLSAKRADAPVFQSNVNQELIPSAYDYCGPQADACTTDDSQLFSLSIVMPSRKVACNYQLDAVVGPPLQIVGPDGSFYGSSLRKNVLGQDPPGRKMLIGAFNGGEGDCGDPDPSVQPLLSCADGGVRLTFANDGELDATFTYLVDGIEIETFDVAPRTDAGPSTTTRLVPMTEDQVSQIEVIAEGETILDQSFTFDCVEPDPTATINHECSAPGAEVVLDNPAKIAREFVVSVDGVETTHEVDAFSMEKVDVPVPEDGSVEIVVTFRDSELARQLVARDCERPSATIEPSCAAGGVDVILTNTGENVAMVDLFVDGELLTTVPVGPGETDTAFIPTEEDSTVVISAESNGLLLASQEVDTDCEELELVSVTLECASGGYLITVGSIGENAATFVVTKDGEQIGEPVVAEPDTTESVLVPFAEDEAGVIEVTSGDVLVSRVDRQRDCEPEAPTVSIECADDEPQIRVVNNDDEDATFELFQDGTSLGTIDVEAEGSAVQSVDDGIGTFSVRNAAGDEVASTDVKAFVCGATVVPPPPPELPRTGGEAILLSVFGGAVMLFGGLFLGLSGWRRAVVTA